jgi:hypothetical protein
MTLKTYFWFLLCLESQLSITSVGFVVDAIYNVIHLKAYQKRSNKSFGISSYWHHKGLGD